ncbi:unnamed protein product [Cylicocyclus nassatus]|uniref:Uncharacterized protein n=1 Tax=Cylicocyclus nassatus TaxID=53992 RepID=A0AA36DV16_CYLNA|nr:unnamed protein product [Cylicocyclus nassatus]
MLRLQYQVRYMLVLEYSCYLERSAELYTYKTAPYEADFIETHMFAAVHDGSDAIGLRVAKTVVEWWNRKYSLCEKIKRMRYFGCAQHQYWWLKHGMEYRRNYLVCSFGNLQSVKQFVNMKTDLGTLHIKP